MTWLRGRFRRYSRKMFLVAVRPSRGAEVGGGVAASFGPHAVRCDINYLHTFQDLNALGFTLSDTRLDFGRASVALALTF